MGGGQSYTKYASVLAGPPCGVDVTRGGDSHRSGTESHQLLLQHWTSRSLMTVFHCIFSPASCVANVAKSTTNDLFSALTSWIVASVHWFLGAVGHVLVTASEPSIVL